MKNKYFGKQRGLFDHSWLLLLLLGLFATSNIANAQTLTFTGPNNSTAVDFGSVFTGSTSAPRVFTFSGIDLTPGTLVTLNLGVTGNSPARTENRFYATINGTPTQGTVTLGTVGADGTVSGSVAIVFQPDQVRQYNKSIAIAADDAENDLIISSPQVILSGTGLSTAPNLTITPASALDFGDQNVGTFSAARQVNLKGAFLTAQVVITAPQGFQVSTNNTTFASTVNIPSSSATSAEGVAVYVRFAPTVVQPYSGNVTFSSQGATTRNLAVVGNGVPSTPFIVVSPETLDFGVISGSGSAQTLSFRLNADNLINPLTLTASSANIRFRDASAGGDFVTGPITINPTTPGGTVVARNIEVQITGPVPNGRFTAQITAASIGAPSEIVQITALNSIGGSSTINPVGSLSSFSTVPGVPSAVQSYQVGASNLVQDLVVSAPANFQVSLNSSFAGVTTTGNSITIPRSSGNDISPAVTVYVRFFPQTAIRVTDGVRNTSSPATEKSVPVAGTSEPSVVVLNSFLAVERIIINTTSSVQTLNVRADRVRQAVTLTRDVIANSTNKTNTPQFELSSDGINFGESVELVPDLTTYTINKPIYVRYKPTYLGIGEANLLYRSNDFTIQGFQEFAPKVVLSGKSIDTQPTERSVPSIVRSGATAIVTFNLPPNYASQGFGENRLVAVSLNSTLPSGSQPTDGTPYGTGNQEFSKGPQIVPGYYVVYSGDEAVVTVTGLNPATTYYFYTFEYNNIETGSGQNLSVIGAENYLQPPVPTTIEGIEVVGNPPLPVTLVSFDAKIQNKHVALTWVTAAELNNKGFEVQRSQDGKSFATVLTRAGKGNTTTGATYNGVDEKPLIGLSYYRLKQTDLDGTIHLSNPVAVNFLSSGEITMYPNPVTDVLNIEVPGSAAGLRATITDISGRVIRSQVLGADGKLQMSDLQSGTYLVTVGEGTTKVTRRIVRK